MDTLVWTPEKFVENLIETAKELAEDNKNLGENYNETKRLEKAVKDIPRLVMMDSEEKKEAGLRYNQGKLRYDLLEPYAIEQLVKVFTKGAEKYAPRNWEKGMSWSSVLASLKRHTAQWEKGEDFDKESGLYHMAHVAWNALAIISYYKLAPHFDDRDHQYLKRPKIGLDIDDVICDFVNPWTQKYGDRVPFNWNFSYKTMERLELTEDLIDFYLNLPPKISPEELPFEPHCYITSRTLPIEITQEWIERNGFPTVPVYCVDYGHSKIDVAKASGIDIFVDDRYENFVELNKAGICTYLLTNEHNKRYDVGYKRINSLKELLQL